MPMPGHKCPMPDAKSPLPARPAAGRRMTIAASRLAGTWAGPWPLVSLIICLLAALPCLGQTAHSLPAGRAYEMLVPTGTPQELRSMPLVVFLPPPGGSVQRIEADWWPVLRGRKCLLAMPASKSPRMWLAGEDKYVLDVLADAQTRYSVDGKRVILMGISGGGQLALFLADHYPERWRAVVTVSANPVVVRGEKSEWFYPNRQRLMTCPYLATNPLAQQVRPGAAPATRPAR